MAPPAADAHTSVLSGIAKGRTLPFAEGRWLAPFTCRPLCLTLAAAYCSRPALDL